MSFPCLFQAAHHPALSQSLDLLVFLEASDAGLEAAKSYIEVRAREKRECELKRARLNLFIRSIILSVALFVSPPNFNLV